MRRAQEICARVPTQARKQLVVGGIIRISARVDRR